MTVINSLEMTVIKKGMLKWKEICIYREKSEKKKEDGIIKVTLELNNEQYKLLNKMSRFLL